MMETKTCSHCKRELPTAMFQRKTSAPDGLQPQCRDCIREYNRRWRLSKASSATVCGGGGKTAPFSDPAFDGQTVGDVWRLMCRAEKWLESRGCVITLDGEFHETKVRKLKKE